VRGSTTNTDAPDHVPAQSSGRRPAAEGCTGRQTSFGMIQGRGVEMHGRDLGRAVTWAVLRIWSAIRAPWWVNVHSGLHKLEQVRQTQHARTRATHLARSRRKSGLRPRDGRAFLAVGVGPCQVQPCGCRQDQEVARDRFRRPGRQGRPGRVADPRRHFCSPQRLKRAGGSGPSGSGITLRRARRRSLELHELRRRRVECSVGQPVLVDDRSTQLPWKARAGPEGYADRSGRLRTRLSSRLWRGWSRALKTTPPAPTFGTRRGPSVLELRATWAHSQWILKRRRTARRSSKEPSLLPVDDPRGLHQTRPKEKI